MLIEDIKKAMRCDAVGLRKFGVTMAVFFTLIGLVVFFRKGGGACIWLFLISAAFALSGLLYPAALSMIYKVWMAMAAVMGWVMSRIILVLLYYLVVTPTGLLMRASGHKTFDRNFDKSAESYWIPKVYEGKGRESYEKQF